MQGGARKLNCWEFMRCGRQSGGEMSSSKGVCPVCTENRLDGVHGGENAGRACWAVAGISCEGKATGTFVSNDEACISCEFFNLVRKEEGRALKRTLVLTDMLHRTMPG